MITTRAFSYWTDPSLASWHPARTRPAGSAWSYCWVPGSTDSQLWLLRRPKKDHPNGIWKAIEFDMEFCTDILVDNDIFTIKHLTGACESHTGRRMKCKTRTTPCKLVWRRYFSTTVQRSFRTLFGSFSSVVFWSSPGARSYVLFWVASPSSGIYWNSGFFDSWSRGRAARWKGGRCTWARIPSDFLKMAKMKNRYLYTYHWYWCSARKGQYFQTSKSNTTHLCEQ